MEATVDPLLQLGNGAGERFPDINIDSYNYDDDSCYSQASTSARSSTISSVSTSISTADSYAPEYCKDAAHDQEQQQRQQARPRTSSSPRSRRDKKALHAARLQRSGSTSLPLAVKDKSPKSKRFLRSASNPAEALAAVEPPHDQGLTKMAFAEQQRWITVQQKTFTKWCAPSSTCNGLRLTDCFQAQRQVGVPRGSGQGSRYRPQ